MYSNINSKLEDIESRMLHRSSLASRIQELTEQVKSLTAVLENIQADKARLEDLIKGCRLFKLSAMREMLSGEYRERDIERREILQRRGEEQRRISNSLDQLKQRLVGLIEEIEALGNLDDEYHSAIEHKGMLMLDNHHPDELRLRELNRGIKELEEIIERLESSICAGNMADRYLRDAESKMGSAQLYGYLGFFKGGGILPTFLKQDSISEARNDLNQAIGYLDDFNTALQGLAPMLRNAERIPGLLLDLFTSGWLDYFLIQRNINSSKASISEFRNELGSKIIKMEASNDELKETRDKLSQERIQIIVRAV